MPCNGGRVRDRSGAGQRDRYPGPWIRPAGQPPAQYRDGLRGDLRKRAGRDSPPRSRPWFGTAWRSARNRRPSTAIAGSISRPCFGTITAIAWPPAFSGARPTSTSRSTSITRLPAISPRPWQVIKESNPLPSVCGRVCPHPCEAECRRNALDGAVNINEVKRFVADWDRLSALPLHAGMPPDTGFRVAVVGAGPAGLTAACFLRRTGHGVDDLRDAGGGRRHAPLGHPLLPPARKGARRRDPVDPRLWASRSITTGSWAGISPSTR